MTNEIIKHTAAGGKQTVVPILTDANVDGAIERAAAGRPSVTISAIAEAMGADPGDEGVRTAIRVRLDGESLLPGLPGKVQRANAARLMAGGEPLTGREIEGIVRAHVPGATAAIVGDVMTRFVEHLHSEGERLTAAAAALDALRKARR